MGTSDQRSNLTPLTRLELRRVEVSELVEEDDLLRRSALVRALGRDGFAAAAGDGALLRFAPGAALCRPGDPFEGLLFLLRGDARLMLPTEAEPVDLGPLGKGDVLGEGEWLSGAAQHGSLALASGEVDAVLLPRSAFPQTAPQGELQRCLEEIASARSEARRELEQFLSRW